MSQLVPQPFLYDDQKEYYSFITGILKKGLHADPVRLYGYPILIAPLIATFGFASKPWVPFQAAVDGTTGILLFCIASLLFRQSGRALAWITLVMYSINPFTSGYVGVLLSEVMSIFLVTVICCLFTVSYIKRDQRAYCLVLAFFLGFLPQVRPNFVIFSVISIIGICVKVWNSTDNIKKGVIAVLLMLYSIPFVYTVVANFVYYKKFSVLSVDNMFIRAAYASLVVEREYPYSFTGDIIMPQEFIDFHNELDEPNIPQQRSIMSRKYINKILQRIEMDPRGFVSSRFRKLWYIWEKHYFFRHNRGLTDLRTVALVYWGNTIVLISGVIGHVIAMRDAIKHKQKLAFHFCLFSTFVLAYITIIHVLSSTEERYSLPGYPLIILYASYAVWIVGTWGKKRWTGS